MCGEADVICCEDDVEKSRSRKIPCVSKELWSAGYEDAGIQGCTCSRAASLALDQAQKASRNRWAWSYPTNTNVVVGQRATRSAVYFDLTPISRHCDGIAFGAC
jgi:hypothetical protein